MVRRETCPNCKGNRYVRVERRPGDGEYRKCPSCNGTGYKVRLLKDRA
ncbi:MAG: hypothetical protein Kow0056_09090 [Coriobacteriia bacterium]